MAKNDSNFGIYADPINYDLESGRYNPDGSILLEVARQTNGRILELGCGTGRVTIPLAERGISITGLDVQPHLIKHAQSKAQDLPIQWVCQDVRTFQFDNQYSLIFTKGAVFQHLLTLSDQEAMLSRVRQHLAPGGKFIIDIGFKHPNKMVNVPEEEEWYTYTDDRGHEIHVAGTDHFDHLQQIWYQTSTQHWQENGQEKQTKPVQLALRYIMPQEMETLLHYNGFKVLSRYGDWQGSPLTEASYEHIYICTHQ
jgi:SAM-dependent methyltransferase